MWQDRFKSTKPHDLWKDATPLEWSSWVWQQQHRIKSLEGLERLVPLDPETKASIQEASDQFHLGITPYYASLMDPQDPNCPIRLQSVPQAQELLSMPYELEDPLAEEAHMPVPGITHRYPDRVLFYTTHHCPVYCRHCTRKRKVSNPDTAVRLSVLQVGIDYIASHPEVRDVLISGGDPLSLSDDRLEWIIRELRAIPHVEVIRLCTRNLVTLPMRVSENLAKRLAPYQPIFVHTHFNHPKECTQEALEACALLANHGMVLQNQMVLLKGVNDTPEIVMELNHKLLLMRVRPYYMFQCDMVQGINHFRTPIATGLKIIEALRGHTSGMAVPHFVIDLPHGGGKVALLPEHVVKREGAHWTFRNYQNKLFDYVDAGAQSSLP